MDLSHPATAPFSMHCGLREKENYQNIYQDLKQQQERNELSNCEDANKLLVSLSTWTHTGAGSPTHSKPQPQSHTNHSLQHTTQTSVMYVLKRLTPHATRSVQAVQN